MSTPAPPRSSTSATSPTRASDGTLAAAARDLARRHPHLARARARHGGEDRALAADRARARADGRSSSCSRRSSARCRRTPTTSNCRRTPSTSTTPSCRSGCSRPSSRRCSSVPTGATACSRCTPRGRSRRGTTSASRWAAFFTVAGLVACVPEAVLFFWNALDARDFRLVARRQLGHRCRASSLAAVLVAGCLHDTLAVRRVLHGTPRVRDDRRRSPSLFIGSAIGGIAEDSFSGGARGRAFARGDAARARRQRALDLRRPGHEPARVGLGVRRSGSSGLTVVLGAAPVRRTSALVRG